MVLRQVPDMHCMFDTSIIFEPVFQTTYIYFSFITIFTTFMTEDTCLPVTYFLYIFHFVLFAIILLYCTVVLSLLISSFLLPFFPFFVRMECSLNLTIMKNQIKFTVQMNRRVLCLTLFLVLKNKIT